MEALIKSGAFDGFGYTRREHLNACEDIMKSVTRSDGSVIEGQLDLFGMGAALPMEKKIERCGEFDEQQLLEFEHEALGMYISAHPIDRFPRSSASRQASFMQSFQSTSLLTMTRLALSVRDIAVRTRSVHHSASHMTLILLRTAV